MHEKTYSRAIAKYLRLVAAIRPYQGTLLAERTGCIRKPLSMVDLDGPQWRIRYQTVGQVNRSASPL